MQSKRWLSVGYCYTFSSNELFIKVIERWNGRYLIIKSFEIINKRFFNPCFIFLHRLDIFLIWFFNLICIWSIRIIVGNKENVYSCCYGKLTDLPIFLKEWKKRNSHVHINVELWHIAKEQPVIIGAWIFVICLVLLFYIQRWLYQYTQFILKRIITNTYNTK